LKGRIERAKGKKGKERLTGKVDWNWRLEIDWNWKESTRKKKPTRKKPIRRSLKLEIAEIEEIGEY